MKRGVSHGLAKCTWKPKDPHRKMVVLFENRDPPQISSLQPSWRETFISFSPDDITLLNFDERLGIQKTSRTMC